MSELLTEKLDAVQELFSSLGVHADTLMFLGVLALLLGVVFVACHKVIQHVNPRTLGRSVGFLQLAIGLVSFPLILHWLESGYFDNMSELVLIAYGVVIGCSAILNIFLPGFLTSPDKLNFRYPRLLEDHKWEKKWYTRLRRLVLISGISLVCQPTIEAWLSSQGVLSLNLKLFTLFVYLFVTGSCVLCAIFTIRQMAGYESHGDYDSVKGQMLNPYWYSALKMQ